MTSENRTGDIGLIYGILVAGGQGTRIGYRKQYMELAGRPMWEWSALALHQGGVSELVLVVPKDDVLRMQESLAQSEHLSFVICVVAGGDTRFASVQEGLRGLLDVHNGALPDNSIIGVHDAARPFVKASDVSRLIQFVREHREGALLAKRCTDTMKRVKDDQVIHTEERAVLWHAQTPQMFPGAWFTATYFEPSLSFEPTDDASVMENFGYPVHVMESSGFNEKVTTQADLAFATWFAEQRQREAK